MKANEIDNLYLISLLLIMVVWTMKTMGRYSTSLSETAKNLCFVSPDVKLFLKNPDLDR